MIIKGNLGFAIWPQCGTVRVFGGGDPTQFIFAGGEPIHRLDGCGRDSTHATDLIECVYKAVEVGAAEIELQ